MVTFQQAYEAAAARFAPEDWANLSPDLRITVIYEEMRRLDAEAVGVVVDAHSTTVSIGPTRNNLSMFSLATLNGATHGKTERT